MILVDSDVLIAHLRGRTEAGDWLERVRSGGAIATSVVSVAEITGGMRSAERREVWRLLASFHTEPVTLRVAHKAGEFMRQFRRSHASVSLGDYLIAATAEIEGLALATLNVRHFPMFEDLKPPFVVE